MTSSRIMHTRFATSPSAKSIPLPAKSRRANNLYKTVSTAARGIVDLTVFPAQGDE
jgi:hypothetical protein